MLSVGMVCKNLSGYFFVVGVSSYGLVLARFLRVFLFKNVWKLVFSECILL